MWFFRCNGLLCGTYLKHLEVVPLFGTSFLGSVYQHRGQCCHSTLCGGHIRLGIPSVGFDCIPHIIGSVVVGFRGHVSEGKGLVVVFGGHLVFGHGHHVHKKVYCPHLH